MLALLALLEAQARVRLAALASTRMSWQHLPASSARSRKELSLRPRRDLTPTAAHTCAELATRGETAFVHHAALASTRMSLE